MLQVLINGLSTGLLLQIAIGPVFFFILNLAMQGTVGDGLSAAAAVTVVDYFYIFLAVAGVGKLLENDKAKKVLGSVSSFVLIIFGLLMLYSSMNSGSLNSAGLHPHTDYWTSFLSAFLLTISSPLTIVFWTSLFAAKAIEKEYTKKELVAFGAAAGFATLLFLGCAVVIFSMLKTSIPPSTVKAFNIVVGIVLIIYGAIRFYESVFIVKRISRRSR